MECSNGFLGGRLGMIPSPVGAVPGSLPTPLWAAQIAAATPLPDARLNSRLERLLIHLADKPLDAFPQAMPDWHQSLLEIGGEGGSMEEERRSGDEVQHSANPTPSVPAAHRADDRGV